MYCAKCGAAVQASDRFCTACGNKVREPEVSVQVPTDVATRRLEPTKLETKTDHSPDQPGQPDWDLAGPWPRYWARMLDLLIWAVACGIVLGIVAPSVLTSSGSDSNNLKDQELG